MTSAMLLKFACECGKQVQAPESMAGKKGKCPKCGRLVLIPGPRTLLKETPAEDATRNKQPGTATLARTPWEAPDSPPRSSVPGIVWSGFLLFHFAIRIAIFTALGGFAGFLLGKGAAIVWDMSVDREMNVMALSSVVAAAVSGVLALVYYLRAAGFRRGIIRVGDKRKERVKRGRGHSSVYLIRTNLGEGKAWQAGYRNMETGKSYRCWIMEGSMEFLPPYEEVTREGNPVPRSWRSLLALYFPVSFGVVFSLLFFICLAYWFLS